MYLKNHVRVLSMDVISFDQYVLMGMKTFSKVRHFHGMEVVLYDRGDEYLLLLQKELLHYIVNGDDSSFLCLFSPLVRRVHKSSSLQDISYELELFQRNLNEPRIRKAHLSTVENNVLLALLACKTNYEISSLFRFNSKISSNYKNIVLHKLRLNSLSELLLIYNTWRKYRALFGIEYFSMQYNNAK
ncbi:hypothetical protein LG58_4709 [Kosakonia radicincitans YD4]|nr:hypothetical protein LG58_4709 [Kosakonia radicincitans YD4]